MKHWYCFFMVAGLVFSVMSQVACGATKGVEADKPRLVSPPQEIVDDAISRKPIRYNRHISGGAHTNGAWDGGGYITLAVSSYAGNRSSDESLLEKIRYNLEPENTMTVTGRYACQHERHFEGAVTLAKLTQRVWNQLTEQEKYKVDLMMTAALVASAYTTNDSGYEGSKMNVHGLDGFDYFHRNWNPNFREGMIGMMLVGAVYFGPAEAKEILETYDHEEFVAKLKKANLANAYETFTWRENNPDSTAPTGEDLEKGVRDYRYYGTTLDNPMDIYYKLTLHTYGKTVNAGLNEGKGVKGSGRIASGAEELPNVGKPGMLYEFDAVDGLGPRSSITYAYDGFRPNLTNQIVLIAGGYWEPGPKADECLALMQVGTVDLFYKLDHGYINYAKGKAHNKVRSNKEPHHDWAMTKSLWEDVVKVYHGLE